MKNKYNKEYIKRDYYYYGGGICSFLDYNRYHSLLGDFKKFLIREGILDNEGESILVKLFFDGSFTEAQDRALIFRLIVLEEFLKQQGIK